MSAKKVVLVAVMALLLLLIIGIVALFDETEYFYFDVANSKVDDSDWRKPDVGFYAGDRVPSKATVDWNGREIQVLDVYKCCVPYLELRSPVSLSDIVVTTGETVSRLDDLLGETCVPIIERAESTFRLSWMYWPEETGLPSCIRIGDEVSIELLPEDGSEPLVLDAKLVRSGHYWSLHLW